MTSNRGAFEPCLSPIGAEIVAPRGMARLLAAEAAHATDLACLSGAVDHDKGEVLIAPQRRETLIASARRFARESAKNGVGWDDVWSQLEKGCERVGVKLTGTQKVALYEAWDEAFPWEDAA